MVFIFKGRTKSLKKPNVITGGAYTEIKTEEAQTKKDKAKNVSIINTPVSKANKISDDRLKKFVNLKIT